MADISARRGSGPARRSASRRSPGPSTRSGSPPASRALERRGYRVVLAPNLARAAGSSPAPTPSARPDTASSSARPAVDAIFFARGGYGASRILPHLDPEEARRRPRIHLGGSDLTALFAFLRAAPDS